MLLTILFAVLFVYTPVLHDYHVSRAEIHYNEESTTFQVSLHIYADDVEKALELKGYRQLYLGTKKQSDEAQIVLTDYLNKGFNITLDGREVRLNWIGMEAAEDDYMGLWIYLESDPVPAEDQSIIVTNHCLTEVFRDQSNLVSLQLGAASKEFFILNSKTKHFSAQLSLDN